MRAWFSPSRDNWFRKASGRIAYALVLWVVVFSSLEQFDGLNDDLVHLNEMTFHLLVAAIALVASLFEAVTLQGLHGLRSLWEKPDPIPSVVNRDCKYRAARSNDLRSVQKLARKRYGWAFSLEDLQRWHRSNSKCLFLMQSEGELVGYVDAFPITAADYEFLLAGGRENLITPLKEDAVDATSCFYIASVVIAEAWGGLLPALIKRAVAFYGRSYGRKDWSRICAIGYSPEGRVLLEKKGAQPLDGHNIRVQMYIIDRTMLPKLRYANTRLWSKLLD